MSTPKPLYAHERAMRHPELLTCPHGGDLLMMCNSLGWDKIVPRFDHVLSVASRAGHCPHATGGGTCLRLLSAEGQRLAPAGCDPQDYRCLIPTVCLKSLLWWQAVTGIRGAKSSHALRSNTRYPWRPREGSRTGHTT